MIITLADIEWCGVQLPGAPATLGLQYQERGFVVQPLPWMIESAALTLYRTRLEHPQVPQEQILLLHSPEGFRLCLHTPEMQVTPLSEGLRALCQQMHTADDFKLGNHQWGLRNFKQSFVGSECVSWMEEHLPLSRSEAVSLGQACLQQGLITHVLGEQDFADEYLFYRFTGDGGPESRLV